MLLDKFQPYWMKNAKVKIFKICNPQHFFENSAKAKLSKLEPFAWSHWIRKYLFYLRYKFHSRFCPAPKMVQLSHMSPRKNWKTLFFNEDQKVELVIRLFSDYFIDSSYDPPELPMHAPTLGPELRELIN